MLAHKTQHPLSVPNLGGVFEEHMCFAGETLLAPGLGVGGLQVPPPTSCPDGDGDREAMGGWW